MEMRLGLRSLFAFVLLLFLPFNKCLRCCSIWRRSFRVMAPLACNLVICLCKYMGRLVCSFRHSQWSLFMHLSTCLILFLQIHSLIFTSIVFCHFTLVLTSNDNYGTWILFSLDYYFSSKISHHVPRFESK